MFEYHSFDIIDGCTMSRVFTYVPQVFKDNRGTFSEVLKTPTNPYEYEIDWFNELNWIKQINRSTSCGLTVRGMHAQKGDFCQAKLVEAVKGVIYDIITDARPGSQTFGVSTVVRLDSEIQNKLFIPRGFLHGFAVPEGESEAIFSYMCDNVYDKESEVTINPMTMLPNIISQISQRFNDAKEDDPEYLKFKPLFDMFNSPDKLVFSEKDTMGIDYADWMKSILADWKTNHILWYSGV